FRPTGTLFTRIRIKNSLVNLYNPTIKPFLLRELAIEHFKFFCNENYEMDKVDFKELKFKGGHCDYLGEFKVMPFISGINKADKLYKVFCNHEVLDEPITKYYQKQTRANLY
ncbi:hypothetical protein BpHYR1_019824, partial [Brachionus plicatilis]